jgi:hypothetical protein
MGHGSVGSSLGAACLVRMVAFLQMVSARFKDLLGALAVVHVVRPGVLVQRTIRLVNLERDRRHPIGIGKEVRSAACVGRAVILGREGTGRGANEEPGSKSNDGPVGHGLLSTC